ncbi:Transposase, wcw_0483 family (plasmid) [Cupriavidus necator H850]|nr:Transposase, wcw_0483 family [Cupriavidus necator H850]
MGNVLNALPKSQHGRAKADLQAIWMAATRADAYAAFDRFVTIYGAKYPKATGVLTKDRDSLLTFYDFPRPSTGSTSARRTRLSPPSRPCVTARRARAIVCHERPSLAWPSS